MRLRKMQSCSPVLLFLILATLCAGVTAIVVSKDPMLRQTSSIAPIQTFFNSVFYFFNESPSAAIVGNATKTLIEDESVVAKEVDALLARAIEMISDALATTRNFTNS